MGRWKIYANARRRFEDWQPYHEPPAEGSVEWAVDQMVNHGQRVTVEGVVGINFWWHSSGEFIQSNDLSMETGVQIIDEQRFINLGCKSTWKIFVEPRVPGWYSVKNGCFGNRSEMIFRHYDGKGWGIGENNEHPFVDSTYHWIGSTRIEPETPEAES